MDLGIKGRRALLCASSRGLGLACAAEALAAEGVEVVLNGRDAFRLDQVAADLAACSGVRVTAIAADIATEEGRRALLAACPDPDILLTNNGGPSPRAFLDIEAEAVSYTHLTLPTIYSV